jgi:hypothetical protein
MPEVSRFYGIVVRIFYDDHNPPHFHAEYGEQEVLVNINTLAILSGKTPPMPPRRGGGGAAARSTPRCTTRSVVGAEVTPTHS